jgi:protoporphyrinogen oxidase
MEYCDMKYRVLHKYSIFLHSRFFSVIVVIYAYNIQNISDMVWFMVLNATFNNISAISWRPVLVGEEAGVPGENHRLYMRVECTLFAIYKSGCETTPYW